jgi:hypothetical protein
MLQYIQQYYLAEKNTALAGIITGALFLFISFALWKFIPLSPLTKGLAVGLLVTGSLNLAMTISYRLVVNQKIIKLGQLEKVADTELQQEEVSRMEKVFSTSFKIALYVDAALILVGILIVMSDSVLFWKGIGLSLMILGTSAFIGEGFSMQKNQAYQQKIIHLKF